jgi:phosphoenolpyruvate synthase/pyruvate phosphate dikinase
MLVRDLTELDLEHRAEFGGKAAHLGHAARLGCPVLGGVALSTSLFQRFAEQGGLLGEIASILNTMQPRTMAQFQAAAWAIRSAFRVRRLPSDVRAALVSAWDQVGADKVGVRSSATNEDSPNRSFVGQHVSTLDIASADGLVDAALESWTSLFSAKSLAYAQRFGIDLLSSGMGLLVQPMLQAESRGALFTVDPITGDPDRFVLEIRQGSERGVFDLDPYGRKPGEQSYWSQLRYYGLLLDEHDLAYQAIEWAISNGALFFFRVRPATAVPRYLPPKERPANLDHVWRLVATSTGSRRELRPLSRYHLSRVGLASASPVRSGLSQTDEPDQIETLGYLYCAVNAASTTAGPEPGALWLLVQRLRSILASARQDQELRAQVASLSEEIDPWRTVDFDSLSHIELADLLVSVQLTGDALVARARSIARTIQSLDAIVDQMTRYSARPAPTATPPRGAPVSSDRISGASRAIQELMQRDILFAGDVAPALDLVAAHTAPQEPVGVAPHPERSVAGLGVLQRPLYTAVLAREGRLQALFDETLQAAMRARGLERQTVFEAGRRLHAAGAAVTAQDIALLEARELERWLRGEMPDEQAMRWVIRRRETQRRAWRYAPPETLAEPGEAVGADLAACDLTLRGRAVSAGVASGRARVIRSLGETSSVLPGEVLVCHQATFELSPLFGTVAALVAEAGSLLDAGSVLVREYGLPGVFAVPEAVTRLKTGDELVVDAVRGLVGRRPATPTQRRYVLGELDII